MMGDIAKPPEEQELRCPQMGEIQRAAKAKLVA
jgi:hypothetical protein